MTAEVLPPAVVLGLSPTGLHCARILGRAGVEVIGVAEGNQSGKTSRFLSEVIDETDYALLLDALLELAENLEARNRPHAILIPSSDQHVEFIACHADTLSRHFRFQSSYADGLAQAIMAKDSFYRLCDEHGITYPKLVEAQAVELEALASSVAFPWMIKPAEIHRNKAQMRGAKGWIVRQREELASILTKIPSNIGTLLVQEIVPGPESAITLCCAYFDGAGNARQMFSARKLRQYPPGFGSASLVQSGSEPDTIELTVKLLNAIGYRGIAASEFKRHPDTGELYIIEINVRPSLWFSISAASGRPVVLEAYRDLAGLSPHPSKAQKHGVRWRYGIKDIISTLFYWRNRDFILPPPDTSAVGNKVQSAWAILAADDWKPALADVWCLLQKSISRFRSRYYGPKHQ